VNVRLLVVVPLAWSLSTLSAAPPPAGAEAVVARLYKDFGWEAKAGQSARPGLIDQPRPVLSRYFDDSLTTLILKDRECAERTHEICRLDFSPIWDSQDPAAERLNVFGTKEPAVVKVTFRDPGSGLVTEMSYRMTKTPEGWRIHDISYRSHASLLTILRAKM